MMSGGFHYSSQLASTGQGSLFTGFLVTSHRKGANHRHGAESSNQGKTPLQGHVIFVHYGKYQRRQPTQNLSYKDKEPHHFRFLTLWDERAEQHTLTRVSPSHGKAPSDSGEVNFRELAGGVEINRTTGNGDTQNSQPHAVTIERIDESTDLLGKERSGEVSDHEDQRCLGNFKSVQIDADGQKSHGNGEYNTRTRFGTPEQRNHEPLETMIILEDDAGRLSNLLETGRDERRVFGDF
mmetsp:Transcript_15460/g.29516  ORF Transcript_15460/g.29516 Transcript_15460/m.29516 type:complete len:238 (+) Transcript_15460:272-985(+)